MIASGQDKITKRNRSKVLPATLHKKRQEEENDQERNFLESSKEGKF